MRRAHTTTGEDPLVATRGNLRAAKDTYSFYRNHLKKMKRYSIGLEMTDDFDKSSLCGVGKTEVRGGGLEKWMVVEKVNRGSHLPSLAWLWCQRERDLWTQGAQEAKKKVKFVYMQKVQCGGQEEKVLDSKMFSRTVKEWAEWFWVNSQKGELINRKDDDTLETTEVRMRIHQGVVTRQEREGSPKQCPLSVLSLTKTPRLQLLKMKRAEVK